MEHQTAALMVVKTVERKEFHSVVSTAELWVEHWAALKDVNLVACLVVMLAIQMAAARAARKADLKADNWVVRSVLLWAGYLAGKRAVWWAEHLVCARAAQLVVLKAVTMAVLMVDAKAVPWAGESGSDWVGRWVASSVAAMAVPWGC